MNAVFQRSAALRARNLDYVANVLSVCFVDLALIDYTNTVFCLCTGGPEIGGF